MDGVTKSTIPFESVVLAGGLGTRLRSVVDNLPKALAPVAGKPFLDILLHLLVQRGCERIVLSVGYMAEKIMMRYGRRFEGAVICYAREEQPLGTGGGLKFALSYCDNPFVVVANGDTFVDLEIQEILTRYHSDLFPVLVGREVPDTTRYGRLQIDQGCVTRFIGKGFSGKGYINTGYYIMSVDALDEFVPESPFSLEEEYLTSLVGPRSLTFFQTQGLFIDIGIPEDYALAQKLLSKFL